MEVLTLSEIAQACGGEFNSDIEISSVCAASAHEQKANYYQCETSAHHPEIYLRKRALSGCDLIQSVLGDGAV